MWKAHIQKCFWYSIIVDSETVSFDKEFRCYYAAIVDRPGGIFLCRQPHNRRFRGVFRGGQDFFDLQIVLRFLLIRLVDN